MNKTLLYLSVSFLFLVLTGCAQQAAVQSGKTVPASAEKTSTSQQQNQTISILNFAFDPATVTVKSGTTLTWVNNDSAAHNVLPDPNSSNAGAPGFGSGNLSHGDSYSFTFAEAGTFDYFCRIHPLMKGKVVVAPAL